MIFLISDMFVFYRSAYVRLSHVLHKESYVKLRKMISETLAGFYKKKIDMFCNVLEGFFSCQVAPFLKHNLNNVIMFSLDLKSCLSKIYIFHKKKRIPN